jgi:hypothetical protein
VVRSFPSLRPPVRRSRQEALDMLRSHPNQFCDVIPHRSDADADLANRSAMPLQILSKPFDLLSQAEHLVVLAIEDVLDPLDPVQHGFDVVKVDLEGGHLSSRRRVDGESTFTHLLSEPQVIF